MYFWYYRFKYLCVYITYRKDKKCHEEVEVPLEKVPLGHNPVEVQGRTSTWTPTPLHWTLCPVL